jgi:hypothetical protein
MFATKADAKASADAQTVRFTWRAPLLKFSSRRAMVMATRMKPTEKRPISWSFLEEMEHQSMPESFMRQIVLGV